MATAGSERLTVLVCDQGPTVWDRHMKAFGEAIGRSDHVEEFAQPVEVVGDGAEEVAAALTARLRARGGPWVADGGGPVVVGVGDHGSGVAHCHISRSATPEQKVAEAEAFIDEVVARGWQLGAPLG